MSYKTFEIINGELFINEPCTKQYKEYSEAMAVIEDDEAMAVIEDDEAIDTIGKDNWGHAITEPEYGEELIDIGMDN